ncbi:thioredoxin-like protein [Gilbertella persicaria]|uniref:thioredoxin-like protein n=1 Tax=Gilbertella persicaria TaxID=101096 RepID=UPI0022206E16|nr:thioredoxin-like protein [Gilbertella persicaria]KAI8079713.1 thioredoxin-like protein [Gilbertella persicaria]
MSSSLYNLTVKTLKNTDWELGSLKGKVVLFVNVASKCGFTRQYAGLQELYNKYKGQGFEIVGAPCNQFMGQEPGNSDEIQNFCKLTYDVDFPLLAKLDVNGPNEAPLYKFLKNSQPGIFGLTRIKWNFEKFLVDKEGNVVQRYSSLIEPSAIAGDIEKLLQQK